MIHSLEQQNQLARFPASLLSARAARDFVTASLRDAGVEQTLGDRLSLIASELVTNAVLHAQTDVEVRIRIDGDNVWLEVIDEAAARPCRAPQSSTGTTGRGLVLVDALADAWGVTDTEGGLGKMVWTRISRV